MSIKVVIKPLEPNIPGQAQMRIKNWDAEPSGLEFKVQRNQDMGYLNGTSSQWSNSEYWFKLISVTQDAEGLLIHIGADLLDPLLENINANYAVTLRNAQGAASNGRLKVNAGILPSSALGGSKAHEASGVLATSTPVMPVPPAADLELELELDPEPTPAPEPAVEPIVEPEPTPEPIAAAEPTPSPAPKKGKGKIILLALLGVFFIALLAALGWWLSQQNIPGLGNGASSAPAADSAAALDPAELDPVQNADTDMDTDVSANPEPMTDAVSASGGCALANMGTMDDLQFIQSCLQETQDSNTLLAVIQHAKANNHCGIAQRLYANRAQSGDSIIAVAYAQEYDPQFYADNACFTAADTETALYWYETALLSDPNNAQAMQRAEELAP